MYVFRIIFAKDDSANLLKLKNNMQTQSPKKNTEM